MIGARICTAVRARPAGKMRFRTRAVRGVNVPEETGLEHLRLVSLGCRLEREPRRVGVR